MISEKIELLGKDVYTDIPSEITLTSIPTASELDYVGSEDFKTVMLEKILPEAVTEKINFKNLLDIDFDWICRCLRILNYGPYYTTNAIFCNKCGKTTYGETKVDLRTIDCKPLPEGFKNEIVISKDEFLDFGGDIKIKLLTIQEAMNAEKDKAFIDSKGRLNRDLARLCYMITSIKGKDKLTPVEKKLIIQKNLSSADYIILKNMYTELTDYGMRAGGSTTCPKCGNREAAFIALVDDRFLRPTLGDLREWRNDRRSRKSEDVSGNKTATV